MDLDTHNSSVLRALVVDNLSFNRKVGIFILHQVGYTVDTSVSGSHAVSAIGREKYDLVMSALNLDEEFHDVETVKKLRNVYPTGRLVIVVVEVQPGLESELAAYDVEIIHRSGLREYFLEMPTNRTLANQINAAVYDALHEFFKPMAAKLGLVEPDGRVNYDTLIDIFDRLIKRRSFVEEMRVATVKRFKQSIVAMIVAAIFLYLQWNTDKVFSDVSAWLKWSDN